MVVVENVAPAPKNFFTILMEYPKGVKYIIGNEACERFSFYGLKAILAIFLSTTLNYSEDTSTLIVHMFIFFGYFSAVPGGYIADVYLGLSPLPFSPFVLHICSSTLCKHVLTRGSLKTGKYRTIMTFGTVYVLGAIFLAVFAVNDVATAYTLNGDTVFVGRLGNAAGLILVAIGTGGLDRCIRAITLIRDAFDCLIV